MKRNGQTPYAHVASSIIYLNWAYWEVTHMPMTNPKKKEKCPACKGKGSLSGLGGLAAPRCSRCGGKGEIEG